MKSPHFFLIFCSGEGVFRTFLTLLIISKNISYCGRNIDVCDYNDNRDLTRNPVRTLLYCRVIKPSIQGQV